MTRETDGPDLILDCDGVVLDFMTGFRDFLLPLGHAPAIAVEDIADFDLSDFYPDVPRDVLQGFFRRYAEDDAFANLPFVAGATEGLAAFRAEFPQARIAVVTSCGESPRTRAARTRNLAAAGLDDVTFLPFGGAKAEALARIAPSVYVDDLQKHVDEALASGHDAILFRRGYNAGSPYDRVVSNWSELLDHVLVATRARRGRPGGPGRSP